MNIQQLAERIEVAIEWSSTTQLLRCSMPTVEAGFTPEQYRDIQGLTERYIDLKSTHDSVNAGRIARTEFIAPIMKDFVEQLVAAAEGLTEPNTE